MSMSGRWYGVLREENGLGRIYKVVHVQAESTAEAKQLILAHGTRGTRMTGFAPKSPTARLIEAQERPGRLGLGLFGEDDA